MSGRPSRRKSLLEILKGTLKKNLHSRRRESKTFKGPFESLESRLVLSAQYVANHVLLGMDTTAVDSALLVERAEDLVAGSQVKPLGNYGIFLMTLPSGVDAMDAITTLKNQPGIEYAEPDWIGSWSATPNDPNYSRMWGLENVGQTVNGVIGTSDADIDADLAWNTSTGSSSVLVAIIDSGMDYLHPDLQANVWTNAGEIAGNNVDDDNNGYIDDINGYDFGSGDADPMDFVGHGTHVSGTVGAVGNNGIGTVGVNWNVSMMGLKIGTDLGGPTNAGAIAAINYAVSMGAVVSTHSYSVNPTQALQTAIINARTNNHIIVAAAGNSSSNTDFQPSYPASYPQDNIIAVAATDQNDNLASFSSYGAFSVDIGAPGVNIWSTTPRAGSLFYQANYDYSDGTSMATPGVVGAVALLRSVAPTVPYTTITNALYSGSDKIPSLTGRVSSGGRLNVNKALQLLNPAILSVSPGSIREDAGASAATITVRRAASNINTTLVLDVTFDDASEVALPTLGGLTQITIPAGQNQITIPVNAIDDTLLDGLQTVTFTLLNNGSVLNTAQLTVADVESLSISVNPTTILENAGANAGTVTVTRSNTDTFPPDTYAIVNNQLLRHTYQGTLVSTTNVAWPAGVRPIGEDAHDLVILQNGRIAVFNGTTQGNVSIFNPATSTWQHFSIPGLSTSTTDVALGGITAWGNYVFLSDMQNTNGDPFGAVRLDLTSGAITRFATKSLGDRLFVKDIFADSINEIDPATGATVNTIPMPIQSTFGFNTGMAFDGTNLWVLAGPIGNDKIYQLDANTGAIKDIHQLGGSTEWDGLAWLNGYLYAQDSFIQNRITVYDPVSKRVVDTFQIDRNISGGLAGITGPNALISASTFTNPSTGNYDLYEIDPANGAIRYVFDSGSNSTPYGIGAAGNQIYVGVFQGSNLRVLNRTRTFDRLVPISTVGVPGVFAIGGDDIQGLTTTKFRYRDIYAGLDDQLYVLDTAGLKVGRYNPESLELDTFFTVANQINAVAVAADGTLWGAGANGTLYHFSDTGTLLSSLVTGNAELIDIDLNITGLILLTGRDGSVLQTNTSLVAPTSFSAGTSVAFVTLGRFQTLPSGAVVVQLTNSDSSEISIPLTVTIPIGQQSVTVPLGAVDDNILDGTQTVTITASALGYSNTPSDTINVLDAETLGVDIIAAQIKESSGPAATQVKVFRTNVDGPFNSTFREQSKYSNPTQRTILDNDKTTSTITIPSEVSRLTDVNVTVDINHSWLSDLDIYLISPNGTRVELVTDLNRNEPYLTNTIFDDRGLISILAGSSPFTGTYRPEGSLAGLNGENPSGLWTLEITDDNQTDFGTLFSWSIDIATVGFAPQAVNLTRTGATGKIGVQTTVTIPANQAEIFIPLDAIDNTLLDGTLVAGVQASATALGYDFSGDDVTILDDETLLFSVNRTSVSEAAGTAALTGTVERSNTDISQPFTVSLTSSNTSKLTVPASVTIPAFATSVSFDVDAVDNTIFDGDVTVTLTVSAPAYGADKTASVVVTDLEPSLSLTTTSSLVREDSGSFVLTVSRLDQSDMTQAMTVNLSLASLPSGGPLSLSIPASVTIPANATSATVSVTVLDDALLNGTRSFRITAAAAGIATSSKDIQVSDFETLILTFDKSEFLENGGAKAAKGTVRRSNTDTSSPLIVTLTSSDLTEITVPVTVTIPANAASVSFDIAAIDDSLLDGTQNVAITVASAGYESATANLAVLDHEPPVITGPAASTPSAKPTVTWLPITGALRYELQIANISSNVRRLVLTADVTGTTFTPPEQLGIGRYRVWVRAVDSTTEIRGFWSVGRDFTIVTAPTIIAPSVSGTTAAPTFPTISWTAVADAPRYELWVNNVTTGAIKVISKTGLISTSYISTEGLGSGTYRAWVRASNSFNEFGNWSTPVTFTVLAAPAVLSPTTGGTFDRTPTITWSAVFSATTYDIMVSATPSNTVAYRNQSVTGTTITLPNDLVNGDYTILVRARSGTFLSNWSSPRLISVGTPPRISTPFNNATVSNKPTFNWSTITGTERYEVFIQNMTTNTVVLRDARALTNSYTVTTALAAGQYRIWVRAVSTMGEKTNYSVAVNFTVAATVKSPSVSPAANDPLLVSALSGNSGLQRPFPDATWNNVNQAPQSAASVNRQRQSLETVPMTHNIASGELSSAHDEVMAGWDMSEWWNGTGSGDAHLVPENGSLTNSSMASGVRVSRSDRKSEEA